MAYGYQRPDPVESFRSCLRFYSELIVVAKQEGYSDDQAIEMLKVYYLDSIKDNIGMIGN